MSQPLPRFYTARWPLQIISAAPGWRAAYGGDDGSLILEPVVCWALTDTIQVEQPHLTPPYATWNERDGERDVERLVLGIVAGEYLDFAEEQDNFIGYLAPGEDSAPEWIQDTARRMAEKKQKKTS